MKIIGYGFDSIGSRASVLTFTQLKELLDGVVDVDVSDNEITIIYRGGLEIWIKAEEGEE